MKPSVVQKLETLVERFEEVQALLSDPVVIGDQNRFRALSKEYAQLEDVVRSFREYQDAQGDLTSAHEMLLEDDAEMREMAQEEIKAAKAQIETLEQELQILLLPRDPQDDSNCFLEIRAGAGGDEAAIFAGDLYRMYSRYAETKGWRVEQVSANEGEHGGYKEVIANVIGDGVFGILKFESGGHRVQRVPETESQGRIHTSACTVAVLAEVPESEAISINSADLRVDTFRASGAGGQHVNKTDSAVRLTHIPTGTVAQCQDARSQHQNRDKAWKMLKARLYELEMQKLNAEKQSLEDGKSDIGWGSQIRSYVLDDQRIKDLRTGTQTSNCQNVLDGDIDQFIEASLKQGL